MTVAKLFILGDGLVHLRSLIVLKASITAISNETMGIATRAAIETLKPWARRLRPEG